MLTRWIMQDGDTALIERLILAYGNPINFKTPVPHEVDITTIQNEDELDYWLYQQSTVVYKFCVSSYCPEKQRNQMRTLVRFADPKKAIEYKLRIEY